MNFDIMSILYSIPAVIIGLTVHEYCHAFASWKLGDDTARLQGRLTFNPLRHIDPLGMVFIIVAGFGWAKPVQFNPANLKHYRRDKALIAAAGPASNLALGLLTLAFIKLAFPFMLGLPETVYDVTINVLFYFGIINLGLFIFNILPIPPLDGSHIFFSGLNIPMEIEAKIMKYGMYVLFAILMIERRANIDIIPISKFTGYIVSLFFPQ